MKRNSVLPDWCRGILVLSGMFFLSGCWDAVDIDRLSFPLAAGYDLHIPLEAEEPMQLEKGDIGAPRVDVVSLIPNLIPDADIRERTEVISASDIAYTRALREYGDDNIYFPGTLQVMVIGKDLAMQGLHGKLDSLCRLSMMSAGMFLCLAQGRAEDIVTASVESNRNTAFYLQEMFADLQERTFIYPETLFRFIVNLGSGKNPVLPVVGLEDGIVKITGYGVFDKDHLIQLLNLRDARSLTFLRGNPCIGYLPYTLCKQEPYYDEGTLRLQNHRKVQVVCKNGQWHFTIQVFLEGSIIEREKIFRIQDYTPAAIAELEQAAAQQVQQDLEAFVHWMQQEAGVDCIDICRFALAQDRKGLEGWIDTPDFLRQARIDVETKVKIHNWGEKE